jgi:3-oxoacyl-(acyl-carrier-protein) synthase
MSTARIVITAANAVSSLGASFARLGENLAAAPVVGSAKAFEFHELDADYPCFRVNGFDPVEALGKKGLRTKDWSTKLLMGCIEPLFKQSMEALPAGERPGLTIGTAFGSVQSIGDFLSDSIVNGVNAVNPMAFGNTVINSPTGNANIRYEMRSLSSTVATGFNASLDALIYSADFIRCGYLPAIVAGGLEEVSYYALVGLKRSGLLSANGTMKPFGVDADGFVAGEGCAVFLLETEESARKRGATVIAEIAGYASLFDPADGYNPKAEGALAAVRTACDMAGIKPADVSFVAASANGSTAGDAMEAKVVAELFPSTPVAAYKSKLGECYGASASLQVACALADMATGRVSATGGDYAVRGGVNLVTTEKKLDAKYVAVNSFACDGNCGCVVLKKC